MTIIEKYEYKSNNEIKVVYKDDLKTLTGDERMSITAGPPKIYKELLHLLKLTANESEIIEVLTDLNGIVKIEVPL